MDVEKQAEQLPEELQQELLAYIKQWHPALKELLPTLPDEIEFSFDNNNLIEDSGTGGFTLSQHKISLAFDPNFAGDKQKQLNDFKGTYFHEGYHTVQGFTWEDTKNTWLAPLVMAINEGAATVFERDRAGTDPLWGKYEDEQTMRGWINELQNLPHDYDWRKYKFYDPETDRRWIMYKAGTFIVDESLKIHPELKIEDLATKTAEEILALAKIQ